MNLEVFNHYEMSENQKTPEANPWLLVPPPSQNGGSLLVKVSKKRSKVKGPAQEIQFLGVKWQDGRRHIPTDMVNKITAMSLPTSKKETQSVLGLTGFWRMHIPEYSQIVKPLYTVTRKKNDFTWGPDQKHAFELIKREIAHAIIILDSPVLKR